jgi:hypothetical protein
VFGGFGSGSTGIADRPQQQNVSRLYIEESFFFLTAICSSLFLPSRPLIVAATTAEPLASLLAGI